MLVTFFNYFFSDASHSDHYTLSLHDALPISMRIEIQNLEVDLPAAFRDLGGNLARRDRKSTRLNSSHMSISYAVFCLKKKRRSCLICLARSSRTGLDMSHILFMVEILLLTL